MKTLILARHGESEASARQVLNGDPATNVLLTDLGREQARALGEAVGPVDLVAHTEFARTRETAELAWPGTPTFVVPELNEITFGRFEGTPWNGGYDEWTISAGPEDECPGGGESRVVATRRYIRGYRRLLGRAEERVAFVGHGAHIRLLLLAVEGLPPAARLPGVEPATAFAVTRDEVERALELLEAWVASPTF
jgi:broad specificity phosphatase PhoE